MARPRDTLAVRRYGGWVDPARPGQDAKTGGRLRGDRGGLHGWHRLCTATGGWVPLGGVGTVKLTVEGRWERGRGGGVRGGIRGTNPTLEGDGTSLYIAGLLGHMGLKITRLARGIPAGSILEFANSQMLADAMDGRNTF